MHERVASQRTHPDDDQQEQAQCAQMENVERGAWRGPVRIDGHRVPRPIGFGEEHKRGSRGKHPPQSALCRPRGVARHAHKENQNE